MNTLTTYTPGRLYATTDRGYHQLPALFNDSWFNTVFGDLEKAFDVPNAVYPYNVKTVKDSKGELKEYIVEVALAGVKKDNIDVKVRDGQLHIDIANDETLENENVSYVRRGISKRKGQLSFQLGEKVNIKKISSAYIDGLLKVTVPIVQPEVVNIDIKVA
jgi:HSP20 family protein